MSNLYKISEELRNIYSQIEENEGELTPELEEALSITEEDFQNKISDYSELLKQLNADLFTIDTESKRLSALKKSKENLVNKLKETMADAIEEFGYTNKTGSKYIDLGSTKISVRHSSKCETDDDTISSIGNTMNNYIKNMSDNGLIGQVSFEEDFLKDIGEGFDRNDIANINFTVKFSGTLLDLCDNNKKELLKLMPNAITDITYSASKSHCTDVMKQGTPLRIARIVPTKSITIK